MLYQLNVSSQLNEPSIVKSGNNLSQVQHCLSVHRSNVPHLLLIYFVKSPFY